MDDNGSSSGGGNSSVWLQATGSKYNKGIPKLANRLRTPTAPVASGSPAQAVVTIEETVHHPAQGEVKIGSTKTGEGRVEVHDTTDFDQIGVSRTHGVPGHPGMFRVCLRFKKDLLDKIDNKDYKDWIVESARRLPGLIGEVPGSDKGDVFLVLHVPAIKRKPLPENGGAWQDMPWEIHWEW